MTAAFDDLIIRHRDRGANLALIAGLVGTFEFDSLYALGGFTPHSVMSAIGRWPEDFGQSG